MSNPLLHIKDSYYFELPKFLVRSDRQARSEFPDYWVRLDNDFQNWEAEELYDFLHTYVQNNRSSGINLPPKRELLKSYHAWRARSENFAKPFDRFLEEAPGQEWFQKPMALGEFANPVRGEDQQTFEARLYDAEQKNQPEWEHFKALANNVEVYQAKTPPWSEAKIEQYNRALDGKVLIPQPFGTLRNNYQAESGFCISKFMIVELIVAVLIWLAFSTLAQKVQFGRPAKKKLWNLLEVFLVFIRDEIARPAIGAHDADRFVPLLWTIFLFILGCNLMGMIPYLGAPTSSFSVTLAMALVTFSTVLVAGTMRFGFLGFWKNQVPSMGLPLVLAIPIVPMIFAIEVLGLCIRHGVLGVRLLANMVAGHLVLLAIMGLAVAAASSTITMWSITSVISVLGSVLFSCLELFVAFLQAYVFTFLSALFIGSAVHHH